ncbi:hypothetical protein N658DRAFT_94001 [Parathielavia hyrcaniae]|uniref:Uncharacterized protein n=1 Tax=Parathielavia hyrcaniae TaxID=113614 RepID=A0AAN6Q4B1_9PEZI|nr:hypothetical protein N658DRAFT_94001 [Parathielavia hyrcaniae]
MHQTCLSARDQRRVLRGTRLFFSNRQLLLADSLALPFAHLLFLFPQGLLLSNSPCLAWPAICLPIYLGIPPEPRPPESDLPLPFLHSFLVSFCHCSTGKRPPGLCNGIVFLTPCHLAVSHSLAPTLDGRFPSCGQE